MFSICFLILFKNSAYDKANIINPSESRLASVILIEREKCIFSSQAYALTDKHINTHEHTLSVCTAAFRKQADVLHGSHLHTSFFICITQICRKDRIKQMWNLRKRGEWSIVKRIDKKLWVLIHSIESVYE